MYPTYMYFKGVEHAQAYLDPLVTHNLQHLTGSLNVHLLTVRGTGCPSPLTMSLKLVKAL